MNNNHNLYAALRAAFPADLDRTAVETVGGAHAGLRYSWRDLDRASAMMANLLASLKLPAGSRIAVQVEKSVEALVLYLATLRAGHVFLPLNTAYQAGEIEYFIGNAEPAVVVCSQANFGWVSKIAFKAGTRHVFTLDDNRTGSLLQRAAHHSDVHTPATSAADDLGVIIYTSGTTGRSKGAMLSHGNMLSNAQVLRQYWGWQPDDVLIHALPIFHVHGLFVAIHGALINGSPMLWLNKFEPRAVLELFPRATAARPNGAAATWACPCPATNSGWSMKPPGPCRWARSARSRCAGPTCSRATGACPRRPPRSSPPTASSRPATWAASTSVAT